MVVITEEGFSTIKLRKDYFIRYNPMKTMVEATVLSDAKPVKADHRKGMVRKASGLIEF